MSPFAANVENLILEDVTLTTWLPETFIGLSNLRELILKNIKLVNIHSGALKIIDDTLRTLDIKAINVWDPINVTGSANPVKLTAIDFSRNDFFDILNAKSFAQLQNCKILYLNSCKISSLAVGTLDHLKSIEILFLNNNYIHQIPVGLFNVILSLNHKPRINLQDNPWFCECSLMDLRQLHTQDLLIVEPSCYYPLEIRGLTFSEFDTYCLNNETQTEVITDVKFDQSFHFRNNQTVDIKNELMCGGSNKDDVYMPQKLQYVEYRCIGNRIQNFELIPVVLNEGNDAFHSNNQWLKPVFYSKSKPYSVIEIASYGPSNSGLLWYQSECPQEIYCVPNLPKVLRVYDIKDNNDYTFCRINNGTVYSEDCVIFNLSKSGYSFRRHYAFLLCVLTAFICLSCGALGVYGLIRKHPGLLKGSKRIVFVKHKQVDALVLPPQVPFRNNMLNDTNFTNHNIFIVSPCVNNTPWKFTRMNSTRSTNSNPSYISAIQPSDEQLAQWRLRHHLEKDLTICSHDSNASKFSWIYEADSLPYIQLDCKEPVYDTVN
ncbi:uncharacterized protein [Battus philenor]|uniref:uncharacterized protein n=1 Tax=Battus philenor TaxID=42288 RepID=UPI0035D017A6